MTISYTSRRGKTYYLHTGPQRGGGPQHYVSTDPEGPLPASVPKGFEIYETPNGQVYVRRKKPALQNRNGGIMVAALCQASRLKTFRWNCTRS